MTLYRRRALWGVVFDGQSNNLVGGYWPVKVMTGRVSTYVHPTLVAILGASWAQLALSAAVRRDPHANLGQSTVLSMCGGTTGVTNGDNAATLYADHKNYAQAAKAAGFDKVVVQTILPATGFTAGQNTERRAANELLMANGDGVFDAVVDVASDSASSNPGGPPSGVVYFGSGNLDTPGDTTYYSDGLHLKAAGTDDYAASVAPALTALGVL